MARVQPLTCRSAARALTILLITVVAALGQVPAVPAAGSGPLPPTPHYMRLGAPRSVDFRRLPSASGPRARRPTPFHPRDQASFAARQQLANQGSSGRRVGVHTVTGALSPAKVSSQQLASFPVMDLSTQVGLYPTDQDIQPPDTQLAAGPTYLAEAVNSNLSVWAKTGGIVAAADLNVFFPVPVGYGFTDPRILYDAESSRWFLSGLAFSATNDSQLYIAVSATSDPTGTWSAFVVTSMTGTVGDQPMIGVNTDKVVMSWNDFGGVSGTTFTGQETWVLQKSDLLSALAPHATSFSPDLNRYRIVPSQSLTPTTTEWLVYNNAMCSGTPQPGCTNGSPSVGVVAITGTPVLANVAWNEQDPGIQLTHQPPSPRQPSGTAVTQEIDDRFLSSVFQGGTLWLSGTDSCVPSGDTTARDCMRLVQVLTGVNATVANDLDVGGLGLDMYFPAVTVNSLGDLFVGFSESSSSIFPSALGIDSLASAPATFDAPVTIGTGATSYLNPPTNRWGDYSGAATDPSNPADVWLTAEYQASSTVPANWGTATSRVAIQPSITTVIPGSGTTAGGTSVTITGSHFQPGSSVSFGANPASNVVVVSSTQITATTPAGVAGAVSVGVTGPDGTSAALPSAYTYIAPAAYTPLTPARLLDTRNSGGPLGPGGSRSLTVAGVGPVPAGATAVIVNVTVTDTTSTGFLTVYPAGTPRPLASNLNWVPQETIANLVTVQIGAGGAISFYNSVGSTDVVVDLQGYFAPPSGSAGGEVALAPARITDTRTGSGLPNAGSTLGPGGLLDVQATGVGGVPATGAAAVILNVTVTNTTAPSFLTVWPTGAAKPTASNLNWTPGQTIPNRVIVPVGTGGMVRVFNNVGSADVIVDISGYFTDATASGRLFIPQSPLRILDTRNSGGTLGPGGKLTLQLAGVGGVPNSAAAVVINVTVTNTTMPSFLTVFPSTAGRPLASDLNWDPGETIPNLVIATLGTTGALTVFNNAGSTDVVIDLAGYYG